MATTTPRRMLIFKIQKRILALSTSQLLAFASAVDKDLDTEDLAVLSEPELFDLIVDYLRSEKLRGMEDEGMSQLLHLDDMLDDMLRAPDKGDAVRGAGVEGADDGGVVEAAPLQVEDTATRQLTSSTAATMDSHLLSSPRERDIHTPQPTMDRDNNAPARNHATTSPARSITNSAGGAPPGRASPSSSMVSHTLKYFYTASSDVPNFPEYVSVGMVDDVQITHYDSNTQRCVPKQDWMNQVTTDDPQYWEKETQNNLGNQQVYKANIDTAKQRFNQTGGVHIFQVMYGCEWDDETGDTDGFNQLGYDGEDFLSLDLKRETWVTPKPQGFITKLKWDHAKADMVYNKHYYTSECIEWLKNYLTYGKNILQRTELPSVSFLQKTPSSPVRCHATGFYPDRAMMFWAKHGEQLQENVDHGELLNNHDGTFQMSVDLNLTSVKHEDWKQYECVFEFNGVKDVFKYRLDRSLIKTNRVEPEDNMNIIIIAVVVLAVLAVVAAIVTGVVMYRKKKASRPPSPSEVKKLNPDA